MSTQSLKLQLQFCRVFFNLLELHALFSRLFKESKVAIWIFIRNHKISRKCLIFLTYFLKPPPLTYMCFSFDSSCESSPDTPLPVHQCLNSGHPEKNQLSSCLGWESAEDERDDGWLGSVHWCAISPSRRWRSMGLPFSSFSFTEIELLLFVHWLCCVNLARAETSFQFY